uniref:Anaphase-promoting complex subunit 4 WD40 domain-containing protein n=1 Tax=Chlamydomonas euryale TaxID=1486919 RepID=A0A7R9VPV1_9CHLO
MATGPSGQTNEGMLDGQVLADLDETDRQDFDDGDDDGDDGGTEVGGADAMAHDGDELEQDGEEDSIHQFEGHQDAVLAVAWSPAHPDLVASGGQDDAAFLWRVGQDAFENPEGALSTAELPGHTDSVASVAFNTAGTLLATAGMEGIVKVWNTADGSLMRSLDGPGGSVDWVRWHPKGDVVLAGSEDFTMWMWLAQSGQFMQVFSGHSGPVTCGMFTPDGKAVVSCGGEDDCSLRVWNPKTGACSAQIQGHGFHAEGLTSLDILADGMTVISGAEDGSVRLSNVGTGRVVGALEGHDEASSVEAVGFSRLLPLAASAGIDGKLLVWDLSTLSQRGCGDHLDGVTRMGWHPTQPLVFTGCLDGAARCWDLRTGGAVRTWRGHNAGVQDLAVSPDGSMIITGADDHTARVFSLAQD